MKQKIITCESLTHRYGDAHILRGLSFSIDAGKIYGILGPNGSGKTTLFNILTTSMFPSGGTFHFSGLDALKNLNALRKQIGVVFQTPSLDKKLTVYENLYYQASLYGMSGPSLDEKIEKTLEQFSLTDRKHTIVEKLSGGLARRAEIAKAILHDPKILLLDEPSSSLDPVARIELWNALKNLQTEGKTILLTTHTLDEADLCDELMIMHEGKIVAQNSPERLKAQILHKVVFIKSSVPEEMKRKLEQEQGLEVFNQSNLLRVEIPRDSTLIADWMTRYSTLIQELTYRLPTLEDVFIHFTGAKFF